MTTKTKRMVAVGALVMCGLCTPVFAQEGYVGASYLSSSLEFESFDAETASWKAFGGYNVSKNFGFELSYYDLGGFDDTVESTTFTADVEVWDLGVRGIVPLGERFEVFGRLGYSSVSIDTNTTRALPSGETLTTTTSADGWELMYGLGVSFKLGDKFGLRGEWEAWDTEDSLEAWSLGAYFRFGQK